MNFQPLQKGDIVDIISPATACTKDEIEKIKSFIQKIGLVPRIFLEKELTLPRKTSHEFPSFDAKTRFKQLENAIENDDSKIIWCARGGYGSADLLPFLHQMQKPKKQKLFIGFSDLVSVTTFLQQTWNWNIICAPMLGQIALHSVSEKSQKMIVDLLFGQVKKLEYACTEITSSEADHSSYSLHYCTESVDNAIIRLNYRMDPRLHEDDGGERGEESLTIVGGCISVLAGHFGTKNQIDWDNKILFLEDEGEDGERLERYFNQIITLATEQKKYPKAMLLGNFLEANPHGTPQAKNIEIAIQNLVKKIKALALDIPVLKENSHSLGHSKDMLPLVLG